MKFLFCLSFCIFSSSVLWPLLACGFPTTGKLRFEPSTSDYKDAPSIKLQKTMEKTEIQTSLVCSACKAGIDIALWKFRKPNGTYPGLIDFIITMCKDLKIDSPPVCEGMVKAMKNETMFLLVELHISGAEVCGLFFPSKCKTSDLSWNSDRWSVPLPPMPKEPPKNKHKPKKGQVKPLKVLHISDVHVDLQYEVGSPVNCDDPLCCRQGQQVTSKKPGKAGQWGTYGYCDTPYWTVEHLLSEVSKQKFDYILWTGDLPAHNDWSQTRETQTYLLHNLTSLLLKYFPNTPVYPALGNHESDPVNSFPPNYIKGTNSISWLYNALAKAWSPWLPNSALSTVKQSGFYTTLVQPGFRIVSLNMNYCNSQNYWMLLNPEDPNGELHWLVQVLAKAEQSSEVVHIIGHIPPSAGGDCFEVWRNNYYNIVERFKDIIAAQFFGHTHSDEMEIMYSDASMSKPFAMAYICPSVTTFINSNPSYRTYDTDPISFEVLDHSTYILNLTEANQPGVDKPKWSFEYSAKESYKLPDLSVQSWHNLYQAWLKNSGTKSSTFLHYYRNYYKDQVPSPECNKNCAKQLLCRIPSGNFSNSGCE